MSLRIRLFLLFSSLIVVLLGAQWWMWRSLTGTLDKELKTVAFSVGSGVAEFFTDEDDQNEDDGEQKQPARKSKGRSYFFSTSASLDGAEPSMRSTYKIRQVQVGQNKDVVVISHNGGGQGQSSSALQWQAAGTEKDLRLHEYEERDGQVTEKVVVGASAVNQYLKQPQSGGHPQIIGINNPSGLEVKRLVLSVDKDALVMADDSDDLKRIPIPMNGISESFAQARSQYLLGSTGILVLGLMFAAMAAHRFSQPLRHLASAATEVGQGHLGLQVSGAQQGGEVGVAIQAFNKMSLRLRELDEQTRTLQQREYLSELGEIANGLAHTLRNPLNTLGLSVEQLAVLGENQSQAADLAQTARQQIRRIDQWIRSFLALASQGVTHEEQLNFRSIIQDVVLEVVQDGSKAVDIDLQLTDEIVQCPGVAPEMRAVLQALVVNAVEASPAEAVIVIRLFSDGDALHIEVADQGMGIDASVRDKLFTPHTTTKPTGSGMGLFLASRIISARYRGSVTLCDREEGGTLARVTIPLVETYHA